MRTAFIAICIPLLLPACASPIPSAPSPSPTSVPTREPTPVPATPTPGSVRIPIDDTWTEYRNGRLGFSMRIPQTMLYGMGDCRWSEDGGDHSYRPVWAEVPVEIFEDVDRVFITAANVVELTGQVQEPAGAGYRSFFSGCERIENSLERVRSQESTSALWEIAVAHTGSEADLETLIDDYYGECFRLGEFTEADANGILRVRVLGDGLPPEESACLLNYGYILLYSPAHERAATWATGQSTHFLYDVTTGEGYDAEMAESFRFLP